MICLLYTSPQFGSKLHTDGGGFDLRDKDGGNGIIGAVSYTHLDVYKRQVPYFIRIGNGQTFAAVAITVLFYEISHQADSLTGCCTAL